QLASIAQHVPDLRLAALLNLLSGVCALVLAVTLHAITRDEDRDIAMLGLVFRVAEGVIGGASVLFTLPLVGLATGGMGARSVEGVVTFLLDVQTGSVAAIFFAAGST